MSTKPASTTRRRSSPASQRPSKSKARASRARKVTARAITPKSRTVATQSARRSSTPKSASPVLSGRSMLVARAKLEKLGAKWKELLPRLKKATG